jgi:lipoate-protein ligase B
VEDESKELRGRLVRGIRHPRRLDGMLDFVVAGLSANSVPYIEGLDLQRAVHRAVVAGERPDTVLLLEHPSVYTAGKRTAPDERPTDGTPVIDVDRGGKITWHGPGQLVGYPILHLAEPIDVVGYVRRLEGILIDVLASSASTDAASTDAPASGSAIPAARTRSPRSASASPTA